jgi:predicted metal-dependent peptidase
MHYEVEVTIPKALDEQTRRFLDAVQRSANRLVRFSSDGVSIKLIVEVSGMCREDALRAAAGEVARIFPNSNDEKYGEPLQTQ